MLLTSPTCWYRFFVSKNALRSNKFHPFIISFLHVNGIYICIYLLTARMVAYRFLGYVLLLLRRCTRIYVQQYCTVNLLRSNKFHQFIISLLQVIRDIRMYIPPHSSPYGVLFPWVRTGTAAAVYSYIRTAVLYCFFLFLPCRSLSCFVCHHGLDYRKRAS